MLIWDQPEVINTWIAQRGGGFCYPGSYTALGWETDGKLVAGMTFYSSNGRNCYLCLAIDKGLFPIGLLKAGLFYAFSQLKLQRLTLTVESDNLASQNLVRRLGASLEATLRDAGKSGDMLIYSLRPENCAIWSKLNGQGRKRTDGT